MVRSVLLGASLVVLSSAGCGGRAVESAWSSMSPDDVRARGEAGAVAPADASGDGPTTETGPDAAALDASGDRPTVESIECVFVNAVGKQRCQSGPYGCEGVGRCAATVDAAPETRLSWQSSCGGFAYTVVGRGEQARFFCAPAWLHDGGGAPPDTTAPVPTTERVTCQFNGSTARQVCYTVAAHPGPSAYACAGIHSCVTAVSAQPGDVLTWTSTCGGFAYTSTSGSDKNAVFFCP